MQRGEVISWMGACLNGYGVDNEIECGRWWVCAESGNNRGLWDVVQIMQGSKLRGGGEAEVVQWEKTRTGGRGGGWPDDVEPWVVFISARRGMF